MTGAEIARAFLGGVIGGTLATAVVLLATVWWPHRRHS